MKEAVVLTTIAAYGVLVAAWLMAWKGQQDKTYKELMKLAQDTHTLVNSNMGVQLKLGMDLSEFKAITTGKPEDIQAAKLARHRYEEHVKKQAVVDSGRKMPLPKEGDDLSYARVEVARLAEEQQIIDAEPIIAPKPRAKRVRKS